MDNSMTESTFRKAVWGAALVLALLWPADGIAHPHGSRQKSKLDSALARRMSPDIVQPVIVRPREGKKSDVRKKIAERTGQYREHSLIDAVSARLTPSQIRELMDDSDVDGISLDADIESSASAGSTDMYSTASGLKQSLGMGDWFTGSTLTVAVIDSGIAAGGDFDTRILGSFDFTGGKLGIPIPATDEFGHGTHVAGLIGSNGSSSSGKYSGVAPGVKLLSLKVLDKKGAGKTSDVINALSFVIANRARFGIRVVNLSLGHPIYESAKTDPLVLAVESAVRAGLIVVVAAGNYGTNPNTGVTGFGLVP
jgi:serine protease AprX